MTNKQRVLVLKVVLAIISIAAISVYQEWLQNHWSSLRWYVLILIFVGAAISSRRPRIQKGRSFYINKYEEHKWIKIYYGIYLSILAVGLSYVIYNNVEIDPNVSSILVALLSTVAPFLILHLKEEYTKAGKDD